jgi:hypothetical protein
VYMYYVDGLSKTHMELHSDVSPPRSHSYENENAMGYPIFYAII